MYLALSGTVTEQNRRKHVPVPGQSDMLMLTPARRVSPERHPRHIRAKQLNIAGDHVMITAWPDSYQKHHGGLWIRKNVVYWYGI
jgi:hypothetical protein